MGVTDHYGEAGVTCCDSPYDGDEQAAISLCRNVFGGNGRTVAQRKH